MEVAVGTFSEISSIRGDADASEKAIALAMKRVEALAMEIESEVAVMKYLGFAKARGAVATVMADAIVDGRKFDTPYQATPTPRD